MFVQVDYSNSMLDSLKYLSSLIIFQDGVAKRYGETDKIFISVKEKLENIFSQARVMPAFGVSLHNSTLEALKTGDWVQLNFSRVINKNGLEFSSVLFKLEKTSGINLIRFNNNTYDGRCIYLDFYEEIDLVEEIKHY